MKFSIPWLLVGGGIGFGLALLVTPGVEPGEGGPVPVVRGEPRGGAKKPELRGPPGLGSTLRAALEQARSAGIGDLASRLAFAARKALADEGMDRRWVTVATYP